MNIPTESSDLFAEFPPLEFYPFDPLPSPNPIPSSLPPPLSPVTLAATPTSDPHRNPSLAYNPLAAFTIPKKRRRGRSQRNVAPSFQLPSFPNGNPSLPSSSASSAASAYAADPSKINNAGVAAGAAVAKPVPAADFSDEIIVINREATTEALIALSAGFPADSLTDEEIDFGVLPVIGGIEQVNYILIRNHIIARWRENVTGWVSKEMFVDVIPKHYGALLDTAYNYLVSRGFINFGVSAAIKEKFPPEPTKSSVIVIGAGFAGLAAARQLMRFGFKVTVLEGRKRAGGRVYTKKMEGGNRLSAAADLGGSVLTGTLGNPLGIVARQLGYFLHKVRDKCPLYSVDGKPVDPDVDMKVETAFNRLLDKASRLRQLMGEVSVDVSLGSALETFRPVYGDAVNSEEMNLFDWHFANLEYANAGLLSKLSLAFWDQDDPYDMGGDHCFLHGGNGKLVQALAENVPILYEKTVNTIRYGSDGVQVVAGNQVFEGDMVLCTVPLGVLKNGSIKFVPELPQRKLESIKRMGFGLLNKVAMLFPYNFWGTDLDTFGHLTDDSSTRGEFFLFYSYATVAGGPLLLALVAGESAVKFESMPPTDAVTRVIQILKGIYEPQGVTVPEPVQTVCTRWGSDPFCLGSYSNVAVGASGDDYDILAESVGDGRLFFAGEATTRRYPATMHGAFLTGLREAANMAHYAHARSSRIRIDRSPSKNAHSCASLLTDLFREPDLEFGSYAVIFCQKNSDPKCSAILRVTLNEPNKKSQDGLQPDQHSNKLLFQQLQSHFNQQQQLHIYALLSKQQALELREVRGGDEMRLHYLCEKIGVKLIGRKGLGPTADSVIASIKAERGKRKPASAALGVRSGGVRHKPGALKQRVVRKAKIMRKSSGQAPPSNTNADGSGKVTEEVRSTNPSISLASQAPPKISAGGSGKVTEEVRSTNPSISLASQVPPKISAGGSGKVTEEVRSTNPSISLASQVPPKTSAGGSGKVTEDVRSTNPSISLASQVPPITSVGGNGKVTEDVRSTNPSISLASGTVAAQVHTEIIKQAEEKVFPSDRAAPQP